MRRRLLKRRPSLRGRKPGPPPLQCLLILLACALLASCASDGGDGVAGPATHFDPALPGPYPVGNISLILTDPDRYDETTHSERQLLVEVWYPATRASSTLPEGKIVDFVDDRWSGLVSDLIGFLVSPEEAANLQGPTGSHPAAPADVENGPYPLVLFSHGNGGVRFQNFSLARHLASHGYVFAAPDHTENAAFTALPDQLVIFNPLLMIKSFVDRPQDILFLLNTLEARTASGSGDPLEGLIDPRRVAVAGHSFGGPTVMLAVQLDARIGAGITLAGPWIAPALFSLNVPMMYMIGLEDRTVGVPYNPWIVDVYRASPVPKFLLEVEDGGHYTFTDACVLIPTLFGAGDGCGEGTRLEDGSPFEYLDHATSTRLLNAYVTAFLGQALKGDRRCLAYLEANHFPGDMRYSFETE